MCVPVSVCQHKYIKYTRASDINPYPAQYQLVDCTELVLLLKSSSPTEMKKLENTEMCATVYSLDGILT